MIVTACVVNCVCGETPRLVGVQNKAKAWAFSIQCECGKQAPRQYDGIGQAVKGWRDYIQGLE